MNRVQATGAMEALRQAAPAIRRVILLHPRRGLLARPEGDLAERDEALAREYTPPLQQACALASALNWGPAWRLSLRAERGQAVFAFLPGGLILGIEADASGLPGRLREHVARAAAALEAAAPDLPPPDSTARRAEERKCP